MSTFTRLQAARRRLVAWLNIPADACDNCILYAFAGKVSPVFIGTGADGSDRKRQRTGNGSIGLHDLPIEVLMYILSIASQVTRGTGPEHHAPLWGLMNASKQSRKLVIDYLTDETSTVTINFDPEGSLPGGGGDIPVAPRGTLVVKSTVYNGAQAEWLSSLAKNAREVRFDRQTLHFVSPPPPGKASTISADGESVVMHLELDAVEHIVGIASLRIPSLVLETKDTSGVDGDAFERALETKDTSGVDGDAFERVLVHLTQKEEVPALAIIGYELYPSDTSVIASIPGLKSLVLDDITEVRDDDDPYIADSLKQAPSLEDLIVRDHNTRWLDDMDGESIGAIPNLRHFTYINDALYWRHVGLDFYTNLFKADAQKPNGPSIVSVQDTGLVVQTDKDIADVIVALQGAYPRSPDAPLTFDVRGGWDDDVRASNVEKFKVRWADLDPPLEPAPRLVL